LTTILDVSALVMVGIEGVPAHQAGLTFAIARHAVVDIAHVFNTSPHAPHNDRLPPSELARLRDSLGAHGIALQGGETADERLRDLRQMYEPYVHALSVYLLMPLPEWQVASKYADNWQTSAWGRVSHV
jgi:hypothetical protein